ncbi:glycosyltransferase [Polaribacter sp. L3A8]|uniref:glycosyltransferase n=1 Tax=Polaribacter sp. L3A8 TaxID=2686361 RepID=UPI00131BA20C|nr:glycosyltransferase [Polaribacter sp. L3A8]
MNKPALVSIITPCYNGDKFVSRLLDSVLSQTYANIEMIFIDDGSIDSTEKIVRSYIPKFNSKGYSLSYIYQKNSGQAEAINKGLKLFNGDYLTWPDSDDFYVSNFAIEKMVCALDNSCDNVSVVRCSAQLLDEYTLDLIGNLETDRYQNKEADLFEDSMFCKNNFYFQPICYMVKTSSLLKKITEREIYTTKDGGQNWQIMLPLFYNQKCYLLNETLCAILVRQESHSKGVTKSYDEICKRNAAYENTLINTLDKMTFMPVVEKVKYLKFIKDRYLLIEFKLSAKFGNTNRLREVYSDLNDTAVSKKNTLLYYISWFPFGSQMLIFGSEVLVFKKRVLSKMIKIYKLLDSRLNKVFVLGILFLSFLLNIFFIRVDVLPILNQKYQNSSVSVLTSNLEPDDFSKLITEGTKKRLAAKYVFDNNVFTPSNFKSNVYNVFFKDDIITYNFGEHGYLMLNSLKAAYIDGNDELCAYIKTRFDSAFLEDDTIQILRTDQAIYGSIAIELFSRTKDNRYKKFAEGIFNTLSNLDLKYDLISYRQGDEQHVDLLGFVCPFLSDYGRVFNNERASMLCVKLIDNYSKYGVDNITGVPSQGYNLVSKMKIGSSNWGRGMAWYALALSSVEKEKLNKHTRLMIDAFSKTLLKSMKNGLFTQFPGRSKEIDMSSSLPLLYFLFKEEKILINRSQLISTLSPFIHTNGQVGFNSPSISIGSGPEARLIHDMAQGVLMLLYSELQKDL